MSTNLNYKQKVNVERRTWDLDVYEKKAKEREKGSKKSKKRKEASAAAVGEKRALDQMEQDEEAVQEEFVPAPKGAAGPQLSKRAFLKARTKKVDVIDSKVGTVEMINPEAAATSKAYVGDASSPSPSVCVYKMFKLLLLVKYGFVLTVTGFLCIANQDGVVKTGVGWHCKVCDCFLKDSLAYLDHINGKGLFFSIGCRIGMRISSS